MLAADDANPHTLAKIHEVKVRWNTTVYGDMFAIVDKTYVARAGRSLPGRKDMIKGGRADVRFSIDAAGELYLYSKSDGMIRKVVGASGF